MTRSTRPEGVILVVPYAPIDVEHARLVFRRAHADLERRLLHLAPEQNQADADVTRPSYPRRSRRTLPSRLRPSIRRESVLIEMSQYIVLAKFTDEGVKNMKEFPKQ